MSDCEDADRLMKELTLALLYLASWEEEPIPGAPTIWRAWKNHRFEILDALAEEELIGSSKRAKWVLITDAGAAQARALLERFSGSC